MGIFLNHGNGNFQRVLNSEIHVDKTGILKNLVGISYSKRKAHECFVE